MKGAYLAGLERAAHIVLIFTDADYRCLNAPPDHRFKYLHPQTEAWRHTTNTTDATARRHRAGDRSTQGRAPSTARMLIDPTVRVDLFHTPTGTSMGIARLGRSAACASAHGSSELRGDGDPSADSVNSTSTSDGADANAAFGRHRRRLGCATFVSARQKHWWARVD